MSKSIAKFALALALLGATACIARSPEDYQKDTSALLASKNDQIKQCYDAALKQDPKMAGIVTVTFTVKSETGQIMDAAVDPGKSTAPEALGQCVVNAINGLQLAPPDERDGQASYVYEFVVGQPAPVASN